MSGVVWVPKDKIAYETVVNNLRVKGENFAGAAYFDCWYQEDQIGLPRYWAEAHGFKGIYSLNPVSWGKFKGEYRGNQGDKVEEIVRELRRIKTTLFTAHPGYGKTLIGCAVAAKLGQKALVIADQVGLLDQWEESAIKFFGVGSGRLQGKKWNYSHPLTLTTIQTLVANLDRLPEITGEFGLTLFDEAHKFSCPSFHKVMPYLDSEYRLGVSATFRRSDKLEKVWEHHLGTVTVSTPREIIPSYFQSPEIDFPIDPSTYMIRGKLSHTHMVGAITEIPGYTEWAVSVAKQCKEAGRNVLIISARVAHCKKLYEKLTEVGLDARLYVGSDTNLEKARETGLIVSTYKKFSTGVDAPELDTLLLLTPTADPEQVVGRITRQRKGKKSALVIDPKFTHPYLIALWKKRVRIYNQMGVIDATVA